MKMFKKLMAVALAGVMALALLAGCANKVVAVSESEILAAMTDRNPYTWHTSKGEVKVTYKAADSAEAAKVVKFLQSYVAENKDAKLVTNNLANYDVIRENRNALKEALGVTNETKDVVFVNWVKVEDYKGQYNQEYQSVQLANKLVVGSALNGADVKGGEGTVSVKMDKIGSDTYVVCVTRVPMAE